MHKRFDIIDLTFYNSSVNVYYKYNKNRPLLITENGNSSISSCMVRYLILIIYI
jgi:hypothetical protein